MADRPTLGAVAAKAGVSLKTASRAMNREYGVAEATAARVHAAAQALGFRPNLLARSLAAGGASATVGLMIPSVSDPFMAAVVGAVEEVLAPRGLNLLTASHHDDVARQRPILHNMVERRVDALLVVHAPDADPELADEVARGLTVVGIDRPIEGIDGDLVLVDNIAGARASIRHLASLGHRRIGAIGSDARLWTMDQRLRGYREGLAEAGIEYDPSLVDFDCRSAERAQAFVRSLLDSPNPPTAIFSAQHVPSSGLVRAVRASGRPIAAAMFDEVIDADLLSVRPQIVAASGPHRMGHIAATLAVQRLDGEAVGEARRVWLEPLIIGEDEVYRPPTLAESLADLAAARLAPTRSRPRRKVAS